MRESVQDGYLPNKTKELIFTILDSLDDEVSGAKDTICSSSNRSRTYYGRISGGICYCNNS